ncbi:protein of unknown function [Candidatus Nitrosotalea okcheonensis]|uniref:Uncharacterized protein n=1 Tax=Candidatus Nitrosotalea okcheonensis TaxID=1903276 RepID=A0A2H1FGE7_9ARCH|nr:protein of unknown function [Candidatus Nitrosotalea okcheonensis]
MEYENVIWTEFNSYNAATITHVTNYQTKQNLGFNEPAQRQHHKRRLGKDYSINN